MLVFDISQIIIEKQTWDDELARFATHNVRACLFESDECRNTGECEKSFKFHSTARPKLEKFFVNFPFGE